MDGRRLGGYTLIREIGRGGMGSVYLAERSDGAFKKQVAVKLVQPQRAGAALIARFQREREILASLDHPNIARLIDAGTTEEGVPYLVMEFVEGQPSIDAAMSGSSTSASGLNCSARLCRCPARSPTPCSASRFEARQYFGYVPRNRETAGLRNRQAP